MLLATKPDLINASSIDLGTLQDVSNVPIRLGDDDLEAHCAIFGGSGGGKSKLAERMVAEIRSQGHGVAFIDWHKKTAREILQRATAEGADPSDIVWLEFSEHRSFSCDPFSLPPGGRFDHPRYYDWLHSEIQRLIQCITRNVSAADMQLMNRMKRWLYNAFYLCAVAVDERGTHLGLSHVLEMLDPECDDFKAAYPRIAPHLPKHVRRDIEKLIETKRPMDQERWVESSINRMRDILSPIVAEIFDQQAPSIDFRKIILEGKHLLVSVGEDDYLSSDQARIIAGIVINMILSAARRIPEGQGRIFYLFIDEAENLIGEDLRSGFGELRKYLLRIVLIVQDLSCLRKGELDLVPKVISQCQVKITFDQQFPDDYRLLADMFATPCLDFTPHLQVVDRQLPEPEWRWTPSFGQNHTDQSSVQRVLTASETKSASWGLNRSWSDMVQWSIGLNYTWGQGESQQVSAAHSETEGENENYGIGTAQSQQEGFTSNFGRSSGRNNSRSSARGEAINPLLMAPTSFNNNSVESVANSMVETQTDGVMNSKGRSESENRGWGSSLTIGDTVSVGRGWDSSWGHGLSGGWGGSRGTSVGESFGEAVARALGESLGIGESHADGSSLSWGLTPITRFREEWQETGRLRYAVADQRAYFEKLITSLQKRRALMSVKGKPGALLLEVGYVGDPYAERGIFRDAEARERDLEWMKMRIYCAHPFYFVPAAAEDSLQRFLAATENRAAPGLAIPPAEYEDDEEENPIG